MTDRARFDGPTDDIVVIDPVTNELLDHVQRGGLLSKDVPAKVRDELLARDNWTAVKDPSGSSKASDDKKES
jgi:hypothetical protein